MPFDLGLDSAFPLTLNVPNLALNADVAATLTFGIDLTDDTFFVSDDSATPS